MKAICEGKKTREEVVRESLAMYREVFEKAERQIGTLIKVLCIASVVLVWGLTVCLGM